MNRRFALAAPLALLALVSTALEAVPARRAPAAKKPPAPRPAPLADTVRVALVTEKGTIEIDLDHAHAPRTVENFVRYVDARRLDGITFYRAMRLAWGEQPNGLIQAGLRGDPRKLFAPVVHEPTSQTGVLHRAGAISMARFAPGTATADFSILLSGMPGLDADPASADPEMKAGYAAFGRVVAGMEVVRAIWDSPLSPSAGEGLLKGQMLTPPVKVLTVRRVRPAVSGAPAASPAPAPAASPAP